MNKDKMTPEQVRDILRDIDTERTVFVSESAAYHAHYGNVAEGSFVNYSINVFGKKSAIEIDKTFKGEHLHDLLEQVRDWYVAGAIPEPDEDPEPAQEDTEREPVEASRD